MHFLILNAFMHCGKPIYMTERGTHLVAIEIYDKDFILLKNKGFTREKWYSYSKFLYDRKFDFIDEVIFSPEEIMLQINKQFNVSHLPLIQYVDPVHVPNQTNSYELPVYFEENQDWEYLHATLNLSTKEVINRLLSASFTVEMLGFLPGFIYLTGLPKDLKLPRKENPDKNIEAGSFAIASEYAGLYSLESPGGWYVLGKVPINILNIPHFPPVHLQHMDRIKLTQIDSVQFDRLKLKNLNILEYNGKT